MEHHSQLEAWLEAKRDLQAAAAAGDKDLKGKVEQLLRLVSGWQRCWEVLHTIIIPAVSCCNPSRPACCVQYIMTVIMYIGDVAQCLLLHLVAMIGAGNAFANSAHVALQCDMYDTRMQPNIRSTYS